MSEFGTYDFGLTADEEARAARLHAASIVIDLLHFGPLGARSFTDEMQARERAAFERGGLEQAARAAREHVHALTAGACYRELWEASGVTAGSRDWSMDTPRNLLDTLGVATLAFDRHDWLVKALVAEDFRRAKREGLRAGWLNTQLVGTLTPDELPLCHASGLRMLQPTYNAMNHLGAGCTERVDAGLSHTGVAMVRRANELGVIIDTSHCGPRTTIDCCEVSSAPVIASHTSARAVFDHDRGKSDEELRALAATGGVIGVLAIPFFLAPGRDPVLIETWLDHIDYVAGLVGAEHVAIGTDWPLPYSTFYLQCALTAEALAESGFREEHNIQVAHLVGFDDYRDFPNVTRGLVKRGYSDAQIAGILGENFLRVFEAVCG